MPEDVWLSVSCSSLCSVYSLSLLTELTRNCLLSLLAVLTRNYLLSLLAELSSKLSTQYTRRTHQELALGVQSTGRFIKQKNPGVADQSSSDGDPLFLTPRKLSAFLPSF